MDAMKSQHKAFTKSNPISSASINPIGKLSNLVKRKLLITSIVTFVIGTAIALYQPVHNDPLTKQSGFDRFFYPQENNSALKLPRINADINDIAIVGDNIWLVGSGGLILYSSDEGRCWFPQGEWMLGERTKPTEQAVNSDGNSTDGVKTPDETNSQPDIACPKSRKGVDRVIDGIATLSESLDSVSFFPELRAETAKDKEQQPLENKSLVSISVKGQEVVRTTDTPENYFPNFNKVIFINDNIGIVVGDDGVIVRTENAGKNWHNLGLHEDNDLLSIAYIPSENTETLGNVVAVGEKNTILVSRDLGKSWVSESFNSGRDIKDISLVSKNNFIMVGDGSHARLLDDNGQSKRRLKIPGGGNINAVSVNKNNEIIIAGERGIIHKLNEYSSSAKRVSNNNKDNITSVVLSDDQFALAVTENGIVLRSEEGGGSWDITSINVDEHFSRVILDGKNRAFLVGKNGVIKQSNDSGKSWFNLSNPNPVNNSPLEKYSVSLASWWYLLTLICGGFILTIVWPRSGEDNFEEGIAGIAASDKPLQPGDPDAANLAEIASDITSFLSNPKTTAPLTLAITGPWGCGKSSLMNLVRAGLVERQFSPVWFNAWHHQKGEQLLASLFAHIKQQAIPGWFSIDGIWFRMKLATIRARRHWFIVALMFFLLFMAWSINQQNISEFTRLLAKALSDPDEFWKVPWAKLSPIGLFSDGKDAAISLASLLGVTAPLIALMKGIRGFGISPEKLVSVDHRDKGKKGYDPGARARFASEFKDVTQALGKNKMVIFIDDLDRCSQDNLIDILENINFISSSGDCYLILGMAPKYIKACVANAYETLAKSIAEKEDYEKEKNNLGEPETTEKHKFNFANQYLEKMINIEVAVPCLKDKSIAQLLSQQQDKEKESTTESFSIRQTLRNGFDWLTLKSGLAIKSIILISAIGYGWEYGKQVPAKPRAAEAKFYELGSLDKSAVLKLFAGESYSLSSTEISEKIDQMTTAHNQKFSLFLQSNQQQKQQEIKVASLGDSDKNVNLILRLSTEQLSNLTNNKQQTASQRTKDNSDMVQQKMIAAQEELTTQPQTITTNKNTDYFATFRQAENETGARLSANRLFWSIVIFALLAMYIKKREKEKFSSDSDDFVTSIVNWTPWIQIKQSTPRAIKRFLNHLRFQSIRNRKLVSESSLVAASAIYFYDSQWILNKESFDKLCNDGLYELLVDKYDGEKLTEMERNHIKTVYEQLAKSLSSVDMKSLAQNREQAVQILTGAR